ncbi:MAG: response regulator [Melioribacteraceae bacterium]|nr:response regulator [Melioribacteraceae bacterium]
MNEKTDILYIEDNIDDINLTLRAFKKNNFVANIKIIQDGEEALKYLFNNKKKLIENLPKVIILDLILPKKNGLEILKALKSDEELKVIPVVILTSSDDESDRIKSYKYGTNSYIVKPIDYEKFMHSINELGIYWLFINKTI